MVSCHQPERRMRYGTDTAQKLVLREKIANCGKPIASFDQTYRTAMGFLENPQKLWASDQLEDRRAVPKLVFADKLTYSKKEGYRTAKITLPFKTLSDFCDCNSEMVRSRRLELPRVLPHSDLNAARLPIPPRPHCTRNRAPKCP